MQTIVYQCDTAMPAQKLPNCCFNIATLLLCSGCIILNKTKTPDFTFLGVKLGVCFAIC